MGIEALDEMVGCAQPFYFLYRTESVQLQHQALAELNGIFPATSVPDFVNLGVKISTIKEFLETEAKPRFG
jgi:hypothetical protein